MDDMNRIPLYRSDMNRDQTAEFVKKLTKSKAVPSNDFR